MLANSIFSANRFLAVEFGSHFLYFQHMSTVLLLHIAKFLCIAHFSRMRIKGGRRMAVSTGAYGSLLEETRRLWEAPVVYSRVRKIMEGYRRLREVTSGYKKPQ